MVFAFDIINSINRCILLKNKIYARYKFIEQNEMYFEWRGAFFLDERVRAKHRYMSEELQNCDGIAFGSATIIFFVG